MGRGRSLRGGVQVLQLVGHVIDLVDPDVDQLIGAEGTAPGIVERLFLGIDPSRPINGAGSRLALGLSRRAGIGDQVVETARVGCLGKSR